MRRTLAAVVALALFALQGQALAFHVHSAAPHDHERMDEHRHGPAIHHHDDDHHDDRRSSSTPTLAGNSDSADDVITITVPAATAFAVDVADAESGVVFSLHVPQVSARVLAIEVRSHGPPAARNYFLRGPPSSTLL